MCLPGEAGYSAHAPNVEGSHAGAALDAREGRETVAALFPFAG